VCVCMYVCTISKSQSLTLVSMKDCTLRVPNETTTLFLVRVIIKAIFIQSSRLERPRATINREKAQSECQEIRALPNGAEWIKLKGTLAKF